MKNVYVHTNIGTINVGEAPEGFVCNEEVGLTMGKEPVIKSCLTRVIIMKADGAQEIIEPIVIESCMNPKIKTIIPITVKGTNVLTISNTYKEIIFKENSASDTISCEAFIPSVKVKSCADCQNCGRC